MATIGLRDLYRAPITIGTSGAEEYGTPVRMAKAISAELSVERIRIRRNHAERERSSSG